MPAFRFTKDTGGTLTTSLVSYYKLGDANDFFGTNHGTATNVTFGSSYGKVNNGATFNGSSSRISTPPILSAAGAFSVSCWVYHNANNAYQRYYSKQSGSPGFSFLVRLADTGKLQFQINTSSNYTINGGTTLSTGTWYHVVATYDGANIKLYLNGSSDATPVSVTGSIMSDTTSNGLIGIAYTLTQDQMNGYIDEMGIWSKALSTTEISDLYNSGNGNTMYKGVQLSDTSLATDANLKEYWKLENATATTGHNLTNNNTVTFTDGNYSLGGKFVKASSQSLQYTSTQDYSSAYTISAWINPATLPASDGTYHFAVGLNENGIGINLLNSGGTQQVRAYHTNSAANADLGASYNTTLSTGTWYHVVATWKSADNVSRLYLNGVQVATNSATSIATSKGSTGNYVGAWISASHYFDGLIDDVAIFNRALTPDEISMLATGLKWQSAGSAGTLTQGLTSYYKLEDVTDTWGTRTLANNGTVTFSAGKINNAADGGSSNSGKYLSYTSDNYGISSGSISIAYWVKLNSEISSDQWGFIVKRDAGTDVSYDIGTYQYNSGTRRIRFGRSKQGVAEGSFYYNITLGTSNWYYVVMTYNSSSGNITAYINGSSVATGNQTGNGSSGFTIDEFYILTHASTTNFASAIIDEVGMWSKELSTTEVSDLYNSGNGNTLVSAIAAAAGPANLKTWNGIAKASIKTINGVALGSTKSVNGIT